MRKLVPLLLLVAPLTFTGASCIDLPERVPLTPAGEGVDVVADVPSDQVYEAFAEVRGSAIGYGPGPTSIQARNDLRNHVAQLKAHFVYIERVDAEMAWDLSGRTVVTVVGRVYRQKEK